MRPIDADALKRNWIKFDHRRPLLECIDEQPTIDAAQVVHGRWIDTGLGNSTGKILKCSECGGKHNPNAKDVQLGRAKERTDYCPLLRVQDGW